MSRSIWKVPFSCVDFSKNDKAQIGKQQIWSRASIILPQHLGKQVSVHNGKSWIRVQVVEQMIGHRYGEFALTKRRSAHKPKTAQKSLQQREIKAQARKLTTKTC